ncbi:hypothetical protein TWF481_002797 [Arthrobotrys musiformis]|uniref:JmjC domain-containing protein n=1 Tax=Arthrobotrys musiformis TaxID=47236 RepID=A0AAV9VRD7_9PEZI
MGQQQKPKPVVSVRHAIDPTLNIQNLIENTTNFRAVKRIDVSEQNITTEFLGQIYDEYGGRGIPVVLSGFHQKSHWPEKVYSLDWLKSHYGSEKIEVWDIHKKKNICTTIQGYINEMPSRALNSNRTYRTTREHIYAKDLTLPQEWVNDLKKLIPESHWPLSRTGDLMSCLPEKAQAENLMYYIGYEGTHTPAHVEMCATLGHNLMVAASEKSQEGGEGSGVWFIIPASRKDDAARYWSRVLGRNLSEEALSASITDLQKAPFEVYILEQKLGDLVLVPSLAPHQVWNRGTATIKIAWNRVTTDTLTKAISGGLEDMRNVYRHEVYKTKATVHHTLKTYASDLMKPGICHKLRQTIKSDFPKLFKIWVKILKDEVFSASLPGAKPRLIIIPAEYNNCSQTTPRKKGPESEDSNYDVCMECFIDGKSCECFGGYSWVEQYDEKTLTADYKAFREIAMEEEGAQIGDFAPHPQSLEFLADSDRGFKSLATTCQEVLRQRPCLSLEKTRSFRNKKGTRRNEGKWLKCTKCSSRLRGDWEAIACTKCGLVDCFRCIFKEYGLRPSDCLRKHQWTCPRCPSFDHQPRAFIAPHNIEPYTDYRSREHLVLFSQGNTEQRILRRQSRSQCKNGDCVGRDFTGTSNVLFHGSTSEQTNNTSDRSVLLVHGGGAEVTERSQVDLAVGFSEEEYLDFLRELEDQGSGSESEDTTRFLSSVRDFGSNTTESDTVDGEDEKQRWGGDVAPVIPQNKNIPAIGLWSRVGLEDESTANSPSLTTTKVKRPHEGDLALYSPLPKRRCPDDHHSTSEHFDIPLPV